MINIFGWRDEAFTAFDLLDWELSVDDVNAILRVYFKRIFFKICFSLEIFLRFVLRYSQDIS